MKVKYNGISYENFLLVIIQPPKLDNLHKNLTKSSLRDFSIYLLVSRWCPDGAKMVTIWWPRWLGDDYGGCMAAMVAK